MTRDPELSPTFGWGLTQPILEEGLLMLMKGFGNGCQKGFVWEAKCCLISGVNKKGEREDSRAQEISHPWKGQGSILGGQNREWRDWTVCFLSRIVVWWVGVIASLTELAWGVDSWTLVAETLCPWPFTEFSRVEVSDWLICRDGLQRKRSSTYCTSLDLGRDKQNKSEAKAWLNRCELS